MKINYLQQIWIEPFFYDITEQVECYSLEHKKFLTYLLKECWICLHVFDTLIIHIIKYREIISSRLIVKTIFKVGNMQNCGVVRIQAIYSSL